MPDENRDPEAQALPPAGQAPVKPYRFKSSRGLGCPKCGCLDLRVRSTWGAGGTVRRRRVCRHCGYEMSTSESPD